MADFPSAACTLGPVKVCSTPGCPRLTAKGRCDEHAAKPWRSYGGSWAIKRLRVLARNPRCPCGLKATEVDHVVPLRLGGTHDDDNLEALCKPCHSRKTISESGFMGG